MMKRDEMLKAFVRQRKDEIVVAVYTAAQEITHIAPNDLNYTFVGAMGQGSSHALGIALGRPDKRVVVLDGDGSLLMNLGTLVTIAHAAPKNFVHCLCQNGTYETNGAVYIPGRGTVSFPGLAQAAGYPTTYTFDNLDAWDRSLDRILQEDGPIFVDLHLEPGEAYPEDFRRLYSIEYRERFRHALANS